ncbi:hypothetical protein DUI87_00723 [Hirundo rustica rustica]|uniref:Uncharacterized protein n=1 Tax=Hirundo rustica rustica TaxID=333673 RepID=A0A3M0LA83_HIRRU|nr:hypothetical protein DUI87_00723 [Hirundo rustica rustica]
MRQPSAQARGRLRARRKWMVHLIRGVMGVLQVLEPLMLLPEEKVPVEAPAAKQDLAGDPSMEDETVTKLFPVCQALLEIFKQTKSVTPPASNAEPAAEQNDSVPLSVRQTECVSYRIS